jgi:predicted nucleotidyltransferase
VKAERAIEPVVRDLVGRIVRAGEPERIILFGSRARGTPRPGSDYDFLVIKDIPKDVRRAYRRQICRSLIGLGVSKDVVVATPEEVRRFGSMVGTVLKPALEEGIVVYERAA